MNQEPVCNLLKQRYGYFMIFIGHKHRLKFDKIGESGIISNRDYVVKTAKI